MPKTQRLTTDEIREKVSRLPQEDMENQDGYELIGVLGLLTLAVLEVADRLDGLEVLVDTVALPPVGYH